MDRGPRTPNIRLGPSFLVAGAILWCGCATPVDEGTMDAADQSGSEVVMETLTSPDLLGETGTDTQGVAACHVGDRFEAVDLGPVIRHSDLGELGAGATIADNTSALTDDDSVRLYFWANQGKDRPFNGVYSATSPDGTKFQVEDGLRIPAPYGHPKLLALPDGTYRMFHLLPGGLGSSFSEDGIDFELEEGVRISNADAGLERIGGMSVIATQSGTWRAYFSDLGIPGEPPSATRIKSASSSDLLSWNMDSGVRIGLEAEVDSWGRQPFALHRGGGCMTLLFQDVQNALTRLTSATSTDGLLFTEAHPVPIEGFEGSHAGANVQRLADGTWRLYYDAISQELGPHIRAASLTLIPGATSP